MTVASEAREAVRREPFLHAALRAGVLNYTAAARYLDVGEEEAVAAALRRYAADLPAPDAHDGSARVDMRSGVGPCDPDDALLVVGDTALGSGGGDLTAIVANGDFTAASLGDVLARLRVEGVEVAAAAGSEGSLVVAVPRRAGIDALRYVEDVLA